MVGFQPNFTGVISTIPCCAHHQLFPLHCTKWPSELKIENVARLSQVKLLVGFKPNFTGVINTIPCCAHGRHVPLHSTKWPPELKYKNLVMLTGHTN
jgi:hypothetical protein